jgi:hypothetical protein
MQKRCRLVAFSATFDYCLFGILRLSVSLSWKIIPIVQKKNVDRGQEPRVLDLDPQIQETMDENP